MRRLDALLPKDLPPELAPVLYEAIHETHSDIAARVLSLLLLRGAEATEGEGEPFSLTIEGDAGDYAGHSMKGGTLTIEGNAGDSVGDTMKGGTLTIRGNVGSYAGGFMKGGILTIEGDAGNFAGISMEGGTLIIEGDVGSFDSSALSPDNKGTIIWKGRTLIDNGVQNTALIEELKRSGELRMQ